jgi:hypothetical protein
MPQLVRLDVRFKVGVKSAEGEVAYWNPDNVAAVAQEELIFEISSALLTR